MTIHLDDLLLGLAALDAVLLLVLACLPMTDDSRSSGEDGRPGSCE